MDFFRELPPEDKEFLERLFHSENDSFEELINKTNIDNRQERIFKFLINYLTDLNMPRQEAKKYYFNILRHKFQLSDKLQRNIGFRVASLDYLLNMIKFLKNPKFIEIEMYEKILAMSKEDTKTGCFNISFFREALSKEIKRARRYEQTISVILLDIDNFKEINDKYGHLFGDKILKKFVDVVKDNLRGEDIIARYGGDEFAIMLPQTGRIGARSLGERIRYRLSEYFRNNVYSDDKVQLTFSGGISTFPHDAADYEKLIDFADRALYKSKLLGKNRIYDYLEEEFGNTDSSQPLNKRQYTRYIIQNDNTVDISNGNSLINLKGKILNISSNGAFIECNYTISDDLLAKPLNLNLKNIGGKDIKDMKLSGKIVRLNRENNKVKFYLAMKFNNIIDPSSWNIFENFGKLASI